MIISVALRYGIDDWESDSFRVCIQQWFPISGRDTNEGRMGSDVGSLEGFMKKSLIMKKIKIGI